MVSFAGWDMPVEYTGIGDEHMAVRRQVGLFDVSHMGEIEIAGADDSAGGSGICGGGQFGDGRRGEFLSGAARGTTESFRSNATLRSRA